MQLWVLSAWTLLVQPMLESQLYLLVQPQLKIDSNSPTVLGPALRSPTVGHWPDVPFSVLVFCC